ASQRFAGTAFALDQRDPDGRGGKHLAVIATVADRADAIGNKLLNILELGLGLRLERDDGQFDRQPRELASRTTKRVRGDDVNFEPVGKGRQHLAHAGYKPAVDGERPVEVEDQMR